MCEIVGIDDERMIKNIAEKCGYTKNNIIRQKGYKQRFRAIFPSHKSQELPG